MSQNWRVPQGAEHVDAPCVVLHGGREVAPSSTARGRQLRSRPVRRLASTATKTVARRGMSETLQSERRVQSDANDWYRVRGPSSRTPTSQLRRSTALLFLQPAAAGVYL